MKRQAGLAFAKELKAHGAKIIALCRSSSPALEKLKPETVLDLDARSDKECEEVASKIKGGPKDMARIFAKDTFHFLLC